MTAPFALVDAFIGPGQRGNPAGVVLLAEPADPEAMLEAASEIGQAETAFLAPNQEGWDIRWFTPAVEVDLCGHATLAAAWALKDLGHVRRGVAARFQSRSGPLACAITEEGGVLDFPVEPAMPALKPACLHGVVEGEVWFGRSRMDWMAELPDESAVRDFHPDMEAIAHAGMRGLIITALGASSDVVSRFFAPQAGVPEDHVTGSAHCTLAAHWQPRFAKPALVCSQLSPRGGRVGVTLLGDRVALSGHCRTRIMGSLSF